MGVDALDIGIKLKILKKQGKPSTQRWLLGTSQRRFPGPFGIHAFQHPVRELCCRLRQLSADESGEDHRRGG